MTETRSAAAYAGRAAGVALLIAAVCVFALARECSAEATSTFDVLEFEVEGNSVLPVSAVERAVYPFLGPGETIDDVEKARAALERAYRDAGYQTVFVEIPEQQVHDGVVRLRVAEGKVGAVRVQGSRYYAQGRILSSAPSLQPGTVPSFPKVQQDLVALNSNATRSVVPVLRPGKTLGTTDVDLKVQDKLPLEAGVELNNYQSPDTQPLRLVLDARYNNLWQRDHSIALQFQTSPQDTGEVRAIALSYSAPLWGGSSYLAAFYVNSSSNVSSVGGIDVLGSGNIYGLRWIKPLPAAPGLTQSVVLGLDYKDLDDSVVQPGLPSIATPIQYVPLIGNYSATLPGQKGVTSLQAGFSLGLGFINDNNDFLNKRFNANGNFFVLKLAASRTQNLGRGFTLQLDLDGQLADQPLVSNEQYAAGGIPTVRGYLQSEQLGDNALHASLQLNSPPLAGYIGAPIDSLVAYVFTEGANLSIIDALPGQASQVDISSAGAGLQMAAFKGLSLRLDLAWPFRSTAFTNAGDPRLWFAAAYRYAN